jgi:amphi-Trp domain-containing protein
MSISVVPATRRLRKRRLRAHATRIRMSAGLPGRLAAVNIEDAQNGQGRRNLALDNVGGVVLATRNLPTDACCDRLEPRMDLVELKEKVTLSREEAAARLHAIADELGSNNDVVIERSDIRFVAYVPDQVNLKVEFEIEDDGTELEIELTW